VRDVSLLVAIGVNERGYREILGICEGAKGNKESWSALLKHLKERGLKGACMGLAESAAKFFLKAAWQRCVVHTFSHVPSTKVQEIAAMLKALHANKDLAAARKKANRVKLPAVAEVARRQCSRSTRRYGCSPGTITSSLHRAVFLFKSDAVGREATFFWC
jgi:transposase-like protein